jgi:predicted RNA methylase
MMNAPIELIRERIANPGWTPGRKDVASLLAVWSSLEDSERETMQKRMALLDAPSVRKAMDLFSSLDARSRAELARCLLKAYFKVHSQLGLDDPTVFPRQCFEDSEARVRKAAAQAIGSSWTDICGGVGSKNNSATNIEFKSMLAGMLAQRLGLAEDSSELKAITDALGKSGESEALKALTTLSDSKKSATSPKALLTLQRDVLRGDSSQDACHPERLDQDGIVLWFTPGIEVLAQKLVGSMAAARTIENGVLRLEGTAWGELAKNFLWRRAGVVIAKNPRGLAPFSASELGALVGSVAGKITASTSVAPQATVRIRLGRDDGRTRAFVWEFADVLAKANCGLINDGREAHWELQTVADMVVLVPLMAHDERFTWRESSVDGASDPTIAAALIEMADLRPNQVVYDPFCGAATELILAGQRARRNRNSLTLLGTDLSEKALDAGILALQKSEVAADLYLEDALQFEHRPFDVVITNPPFGMRTVRGGARDLLDVFLGTIHRRLAKDSRVLMLSHAPNSTIQWAEAGRLRLVRSFPVRMGGMSCELQHFTAF